MHRLRSLFFIFLFIPCFVTAENVKIYENIYEDLDEDSPVENQDFSDGYIAKIQVDSPFENCNFRGTVIDYGSFPCEPITNSDFTDVWIQSGTVWYMPSEVFTQLRNFKMKTVSFDLCDTTFRNLNLSSFEFFNSSFRSLQLVNCNLENVCFRNCYTPAISSEEWKQTWNYKTGHFFNISVPQTFWDHIDFSRTVWGCVYRYVGKSWGGLQDEPILFGSEVDMTDAAFLMCDFRQAKDLTLEQVQKTWNYKNNRMEIVQWPEHIEKALNIRFVGIPLERRIKHETIGSDEIQHRGFVMQSFFCESDENTNRKKDLSTVLFMTCFFECEMQEVDISNSVFADCDLSESKNLTLEQVKSTWNYKNGRMSLSKWPEEILKELEKEKEKSK